MREHRKRGVRTVGTTEVRTRPLERAPEWLGLPGTEERGRGPVDGRGRDTLGWEAPRVGALKVSGRCARGCLGAAVAPGAAPDGLVCPGAGLDPRGRRRIAAEVLDWAVCCARRRIRTRAHPEGGGWGVRIGASAGELAPCSRGGTWCLLTAELHTTRRWGARFGYAPLGDAQSVRRCWKPRGPRMPMTGLYAQGGPRRALVVLCEAGQCGISLATRHRLPELGARYLCSRVRGPPWLTEPVPI
ncbi:hypothetical protein NDU88_002719 [Pleurodeles waltl]|uniref:Uncharacterized protein n=1 Tax=Pleurodeles waltl TaxID=8319 RepID=A0AAV7Q6V0_PLEWA|nr:hypothetical protein NDU88_002719 [Pleurodeles waltl]